MYGKLYRVPCHGEWHSFLRGQRLTEQQRQGSLPEGPRPQAWGRSPRARLSPIQDMVYVRSKEHKRANIMLDKEESDHYELLGAE